jgi:RNA polymerase sigma-70 factor (ECF subfamily)
MLEIERSRRILYDAIARLPDKYRRPFALHKLEGIPYAEIAEQLSISLPAVESRIHRAKLRLQKELSRLLEP